MLILSAPLCKASAARRLSVNYLPQRGQGQSWINLERVVSCRRRTAHFLHFLRFLHQMMPFRRNGSISFRIKAEIPKASESARRLENDRPSRSLGAFIAATLASVCQRCRPESFRAHEYFIKAITDAFMERHRPAPPPLESS